MIKHYSKILIFIAFALYQTTASAEAFSKIQNNFLDCLQRNTVPVTIYLINGTSVQGTIGAFDSSVIMLNNVNQQMVYQNAISNLQPAVSASGQDCIIPN